MGVCIRGREPTEATGIRPTEAEVTDGYETPQWVWEPNSGPLKSKASALNHQVISPAPSAVHFKTFFVRIIFFESKNIFILFCFVLK